MKKLLAIALLLCCGPVFAVTPTWVSATSHRQTASTTNAIAFTGIAGDSAIVVLSTAANDTSATIADTLGNTWTTPLAYTGNAQGGLAVFYCQTLNSSSADTITITLGASGLSYAAVEQYNNGTSGQGLGAFDQASTDNTATGTAVTTHATGTPAVTGELALALVTTNSASVVTASSWTNSFTQRDASASTPNYFFADLTASTSAVSTGVTLSASIGWNSVVLLFGPTGGVASCTHAGLTISFAVAVPTASTTQLWRKDGSIGTTPCDGTGTQYFQPANGGAFGAN